MKEIKPEALYNEYLKMRQLKFLVDHAASQLMNKELGTRELRELLEETRKRVLELFPDKEETYNMIYSTRFKRLIEDYQDYRDKK